jgi:hypothetical protein
MASIDLVQEGFRRGSGGVQEGFRRGSGGVLLAMIKPPEKPDQGDITQGDPPG